MTVCVSWCAFFIEILIHQIYVFTKSGLIRMGIWDLVWYESSRIMDLGILQENDITSDLWILCRDGFGHLYGPTGAPLLLFFGTGLLIPVSDSGIFGLLIFCGCYGESKCLWMMVTFGYHCVSVLYIRHLDVWCVSWVSDVYLVVLGLYRWFGYIQWSRLWCVSMVMRYIVDTLWWDTFSDSVGWDAVVNSVIRLLFILTYGCCDCIGVIWPLVG